MGKMFGGAPKAPDNSALLKQEEEAKKKAADEQAMQDDLKARQRAGKRSLMGEGQEKLGVL